MSIKKIIFLIVLLTVSVQAQDWWWGVKKSNKPIVLIANPLDAKVAPAEYRDFDFTAGDTAWGSGNNEIINIGTRYRVRQDGVLASFQLTLIDTCTYFNLVVWRQNANLTYSIIDSVGDVGSQLAPASFPTTVTIIPNKTINLREGDFIGFMSSAPSNFMKHKFSGGFDSCMVHDSGFVRQTTYNWAVETGYWWDLPIVVYVTLSPIMITIGDSVPGGAHHSHSLFENYKVFTAYSRSSFTDIVCDYMGWTFQKNSISSELIGTIAPYWTEYVKNFNPSINTIEGGYPDFVSNFNVVDVISYYKRIIDSNYANGITSLVVGVLPVAYTSHAVYLKIDSLHTWISGYAPTHNCIYVNVNPYIGTNCETCSTDGGSSGVNYNFLRVPFQGDLVHGTAGYHRRTAGAIVDELRTRNYFIPHDTVTTHILAGASTDLFDTLRAYAYHFFICDSVYTNYKVGINGTSYTGATLSTQNNDTSWWGFFSFDTTKYNTGDTIYWRYAYVAFGETQYGDYTATPMPYDIEVMSWKHRVEDNGGTVSVFTLANVDTLVQETRTAQLRDELLRVNPVAGDTILSAVIPLFFNQDGSLTYLGGYRDTLYNFVAGDYTEATGLTGDSLTKWLSTGFIPSTVTQIGLYNSHISFYQRTPAIGGIMGISDGAGALQLIPRFSDGNFYLAINAGNASSANTYANTTGFWIGSRTTADSMYAYHNGVSYKRLKPTNAVSKNAHRLAVCGELVNGTATFFSKGSVVFYSIGTGLTDAQMVTWSTIVNNFETRMGRNVY